MVDSIEELLQININDELVALLQIALRLAHSLMSGSPGAESIAMLGKRLIPSSLQNLHHCLLDKAIQNRRNAELSHATSIGLGNFNSLDRQGLVGPR